jgi:hypothetical protein
VIITLALTECDGDTTALLAIHGVQNVTAGTGVF